MTNKFMLAAVLALLSAAPARAQDTPAAFDSRWTPYLGCWTVVQNQRGHSAPVPAGTMVCVRPSGRFGVAITTTVDGKNVLEQTIVADGAPQKISQGDCAGTQTSDWSRDGERLFTRVELECANRPKRTVSGVTLLADGHWIDSQATVIDGNSDVRLRRYRRSSDQYTGVPGATTAPLSIEDVIEASAKVQSEALEAALDELNSRFTLNSRVLKQLADNGVSPNVIDLMVAQAYPERFEVERSYYPAPSSASTSYGTSYGTASSGNTTIYMGSGYPYSMYDPFYSSYYYYSPFAYPYYWGPSYSYRYRYGYSPFYPNYYNYNYYGLGGGGFYGGPSGSGGGNAQPGSPDSPGGSGIATGRGYTRVRPSGSSTTSGSGESATPSSRSSSGSRGVRSAGDSGSSSSSSPSSSSSSSSGSSSGGYSSGGGGDSSGGGGGGGRTAQPR
ncbi:MAG TPA: hypothetical protein VFO48_04400 [Vicinamibacterales bacterium]|nr:hypothetical protein [Vicinamibacterales bacterium]